MTAAISPAVERSRPLAASCRWRSGCLPVSAARSIRWARSVGQAGSSVRPGTYLSTRSSSARVRDPTSCSAAAWEAIGVALHSVEEAGGWVVELPKLAAGGDGCVIARQDLLESLGRGGRGDGLGSDEAVGVAVADDLE